MKLTDLEPRWFTDTTGRPKLGIHFRCPVHFPLGQDCEFTNLAVKFANPQDGGPPLPPSGPDDDTRWQMSGDSFENLTLTPSILFPKPKYGPQHWHGFITNGQIT